MADAPRRVSRYEHAFRAGRGEPVELAPEHVDDETLEQLTAPGAGREQIQPPAASAPVPAAKPTGKK